MAGLLGSDAADVHRPADAGRRRIERVEHPEGRDNAIVDAAFRHPEIRKQRMGLLRHWRAAADGVVNPVSSRCPISPCASISTMKGRSLGLQPAASR